MHEIPRQFYVEVSHSVVSDLLAAWNLAKARGYSKKK